MKVINSTPANLNNLNQFQKKFFNNKQPLDLSHTTVYSSLDDNNDEDLSHIELKSKSALNFNLNSDRSDKENARNQSALFNSSSYFYISHNKRIIKLDFLFFSAL